MYVGRIQSLVSEARGAFCDAIRRLVMMYLYPLTNSPVAIYIHCPLPPFQRSYRQLYLWIHSAFQHVLTKEVALETKLKDIMVPLVLQRRYDPIEVDAKMRLWDRAVEGSKSILAAVHGSLMWECEEV